MSLRQYRSRKENQTCAVDGEDKDIVAGVGHGQEMAGKKDNVDKSESGLTKKKKRLVRKIFLRYACRWPNRQAFATCWDGPNGFRNISSLFTSLTYSFILG